jgi:hypothetical protein
MGEHPALKNLYNQVIEDRFKWKRWGLFGVLCDYILTFKKGHILEIGCGESSIYLSKMAEKHNCICYHVEYSKSGVVNMKNTNGYFGNNSKIFNMKSDEFFEKKYIKNSDNKISLAFIDGDHKYEQVSKDYYNTLDNMEKGGYIFLHDTCPPDNTWTTENKCGTVYKLRQEIEENSRIHSFTFKENTAFGVGLTMVRIDDGCY